MIKFFSFMISGNVNKYMCFDQLYPGVICRELSHVQSRSLSTIKKINIVLVTIYSINVAVFNDIYSC